MLSRFAAYSAVESKAFRLRVVFGPTGPIQRGTIRWGDRLGSSHAFVSFVTTGKSNVTPIAAQCSPFSPNLECCFSLRLNLILYYIEIA